MSQNEAEQTLTWAEAAAKVLAESKEPLHAEQIAKAIVEQHLKEVKPEQTPEASVSSVIYMEIKKKGQSSRFCKAGPMKFGLVSMVIEKAADSFEGAGVTEGAGVVSVPALDSVPLDFIPEMTWLEAIEKILSESSKPLHAEQIALKAISKGYRKATLTPEATVGVAIYRDIKKKGEESRFRQVKPSIFALAKAVYKPIENGVSEQAVASKVEEPVSEPVEGVILPELKPIEDKVNLSYGTSLYFERPEIRKAIIEKFSGARAGNWQEQQTPEWLVHEMVGQVEDKPELQYCVLFNLEFLEELVFVMGIPRERIMFMADNRHESKVAMGVYGVKTMRCRKGMWPKLTVELVEKKVRKAFFEGQEMPKTNNLVVFGNPPYQQQTSGNAKQAKPSPIISKCDPKSG